MDPQVTLENILYFAHDFSPMSNDTYLLHNLVSTVPLVSVCAVEDLVAWLHSGGEPPVMTNDMALKDNGLYILRRGVYLISGDGVNGRELGRWYIVTYGRKGQILHTYPMAKG